MADVKKYTDQIAKAQKGRDVRDSIVNAINAVSDENNEYNQVKADILSAQSDIAEKVAKNEQTEQKFAADVKKAEELKQGLDTDITQGNTLKSQLDTAVETADTSKKNLDASNTTAGQTKTALDGSVSNAQTLKQSLDSNIAQGTTLKTDLESDITQGTALKSQLDTAVETADTSRKNLDASNTAAGKTKAALDVSNTAATKTKADLDASNETAGQTKTGLDETNKTAAGLVTSLGNKITEGAQVKTDIQTTGETAMSNLQAEAAKQQEFIKTSIDDTLSIPGKAADAAAVGKKTTELSADLNLLKEYVKGMNLPKTWEQVMLAIKSKLHREMYAVGDKFSNIWKDTNNSNKEYDNPLRINHFEDGLELEDGTTVNGMWLQTVYAHLKGVQFSHQQAFYVSNEGMTAGAYCIGFDYTWGDKGYVTKGDYWNFTLTKDVPAGGKLAGFYGAPDQPQTNWRVYVYSADGKTVLETVSTINKGQEGTLLGVMTAYGDENLNGIQQMAYGDNRYATSAIRQYLNSDKPKGEWWTAQTKWDIAPDQLSQIDGYLCGMDPELLAVLKPVKVVTYCNTVTATGQKQVKDIAYDKVTLISLEQMYIEPQAAGEGETHEYYKELNGTAKKFQWWQTYEILKTFAVENPTSPQNVRLRSALRYYACGTWYVYSSGYVNGSNASNAYRPAPLMFIGAAPSDAISAPTDAENTQEVVA